MIETTTSRRTVRHLLVAAGVTTAVAGAVVAVATGDAAASPVASVTAVPQCTVSDPTRPQFRVTYHNPTADPVAFDVVLTDDVVTKTFTEVLDPGFSSGSDVLWSTSDGATIAISVGGQLLTSVTAPDGLCDPVPLGPPTASASLVCSGGDPAWEIVLDNPSGQSVMFVEHLVQHRTVPAGLPDNDSMEGQNVGAGQSQTVTMNIEDIPGTGDITITADGVQVFQLLGATTPYCNGQNVQFPWVHGALEVVCDEDGSEELVVTMANESDQQVSFEVWWKHASTVMPTVSFGVAPHATAVERIVLPGPGALDAMVSHVSGVLAAIQQPVDDCESQLPPTTEPSTPDPTTPDPTTTTPDPTTTEPTTTTQPTTTEPTTTEPTTTEPTTTQPATTEPATGSGSAATMVGGAVPEDGSGSPAATPTGELPATGAGSGPAVVLAGALLAAGAAFVGLARRRPAS